MNLNGNYSSLKIGILGGGQLGRMFLQAAMDLDLNLYILDPDENAPCKKYAEYFTCGHFNDFNTVFEFGKNLDLITVEIEHVNIDALENLEKIGVKVFPQSSVLRIVQDKGLQKEFYTKNNIPTAPYFLISNKLEISKFSAQLPLMQKLRKGGYDGQGVKPINSENDFVKAFDQPSILEKMVDFDKEISVIVARNEAGEIALYPPVEMDFNAEANLIELLISPANISEKIKNEANLLAKKIIVSLNMVGILAVEMFVTKNGELLVNEIAPRPHNSGHQTIEGNKTSQYHQHIRAITNMPLGSTSIILPSVMINLLGEKNYEGKVKYQGLHQILAIEGVYPHIYGKKITKPFRKMGHITITANNIEEAKEKANIVKKLIKVISE
jgi:5-(carboxyamino)imidazole ribonucleotide synthase